MKDPSDDYTLRAAVLRTAALELAAMCDRDERLRLAAGLLRSMDGTNPVGFAIAADAIEESAGPGKTPDGLRRFAAACEHPGGVITPSHPAHPKYWLSCRGESAGLMMKLAVAAAQRGSRK